jgi:hypothetical protein
VYELMAALGPEWLSPHRHRRRRAAKKLGQTLILCADAKLPEDIIEAHLQRDYPGGVEPDLFGS